MTTSDHERFYKIPITHLPRIHWLTHYPSHKQFSSLPFFFNPSYFLKVGLVAMGDFIWHFGAMWIYTLLANSLGPLLASTASSLPSPAWRFTCKRTAEAWKFGSGLDYYDHE